MRKIAILVAAIVILLMSCELEKEQGKVIFISMAIDYSLNPEYVLTTPPSDQKALAGQIRALAERSGEIYEEHLFLEEDGMRYINGTEYRWNHDDVLDLIRSLDTVSGDLIIIHYSGHGLDDGSLVTDIDISFSLTPEMLLDAAASADGKKCLFLDSCYSGSFIRDSYPMENGEEFNGNGYLEKDAPAASFLPSLELAFSQSGIGNDSIWVLAAATENQKSYDRWNGGEPNQEKYGAFTYFLLSELGYDMDADTPTIPTGGGTVTFYGIYDGIRDGMDSTLRMIATPQATLIPLDLILFGF